VRVFNALHGRWGEDGVVQGLLEWLRIPYTHSGVLASALTMDKQKTKEVYAAAGLPFVHSIIADSADVEAAHVMEPPYVVKPFNEGSSVGIYIVGESPNGPPKLANDMPPRVMVETYAPGRELTTTVVGDKALTVTDIVTDGWYDYHHFRRLLGLRRARAQGAWVPRDKPDRFSVGRGARHGWFDLARDELPTRYDAHVACA